MDKRIIRFRGIRTDNGEWVCGNLNVMVTDKERQYIQRVIRNPDRSPKEIKQLEVDPKTIGQYTGLKDKHGKEIYDKMQIKTPDGIGTVGISPGVTWIHWNDRDSTELYNCVPNSLEIIEDENKNSDEGHS